MKQFLGLTALLVRDVREPKEESYGTVAVFKDLYGNQWNLVQPATQGFISGS